MGILFGLFIDESPEPGLVANTQPVFKIVMECVNQSAFSPSGLGAPSVTPDCFSEHRFLSLILGDRLHHPRQHCWLSRGSTPHNRCQSVV